MFSYASHSLCSFCSQLALKHRQGKNHKMRIIAFVGSPVEDQEKDASYFCLNVSWCTKLHHMSLYLQKANTICYSSAHLCLQPVSLSWWRWQTVEEGKVSVDIINFGEEVNIYSEGMSLPSHLPCHFTFVFSLLHYRRSTRISWPCCEHPKWKEGVGSHW